MVSGDYPRLTHGVGRVSRTRDDFNAPHGLRDAAVAAGGL